MKTVAIVGIGTGYEHQMDWVLNTLVVPQWVKDLILSGYVEHYDMRTMPEKGDVIDSLDKHSAVIGVHLYGVAPEVVVSKTADYFYNRNNHELIALANTQNIPVYLMGDQPGDKGLRSEGAKSWQAYEPESLKARSWVKDLNEVANCMQKWYQNGIADFHEMRSCLDLLADVIDDLPGSEE